MPLFRTSENSYLPWNLVQISVSRTHPGQVPAPQNYVMSWNVPQQVFNRYTLVTVSKRNCPAPSTSWFRPLTFSFFFRNECVYLYLHRIVIKSCNTNIWSSDSQPRESPFVEMKQNLANKRKERFTHRLPLFSFFIVYCQACNGITFVFCFFLSKFPNLVDRLSFTSWITAINIWRKERKSVVEYAHSTTAKCKRAKPLCVKQTLVQHLQGLFPEFIFSSGQIYMSSLKGYFQAPFSPLFLLAISKPEAMCISFPLTSQLTNEHK